MQANSPLENQGTAPGRLYSFIVFALATIIIGISFHAIRAPRVTSVPRLATDSASDRAGETTTLPVQQTGDDRDPTRLSGQSLLVLLAVACVVGAVGAIPAGIPSPVNQTAALDAKAIARQTELPLLASVLRSRGPTVNHNPPKRRWLTLLLFTGEVILCVAVIIAIVGALTGEDISASFLNNPLNAYAESVRHLLSSVMGLIGDSASKPA